MQHTGKKRSKSLVILGLRVRQGECAHCPAMEGAVEADDVGALGGIASQLERSFYSLSARIGQIHARRARNGGNVAQCRTHLGVDGEIEIRPRVVQDLAGLPPDCLDDLRVAVTGRAHRDAGVESRNTLPSTSSTLAPRPRWGTSGYARGNDGLVTALSRASTSVASGPGSADLINGEVRKRPAASRYQLLSSRTKVCSMIGTGTSTFARELRRDWP
jgi:hypothetical protein